MQIITTQTQNSTISIKKQLQNPSPLPQTKLNNLAFVERIGQVAVNTCLKLRNLKWNLENNEFFEELVIKNSLPSILIDTYGYRTHHLMLASIFNNGNEKLKNIVIQKYKLPESSINQVIEFQSLLSQFDKESDLINSINLKNKVLSNSTSLVESHILEKDEIEGIYQEKFTSMESRYREAQIKIDQLKSNISFCKTHLRDVISLCIDKREYDPIFQFSIDAYEHDNPHNRPVFHLLLQRIVPENQLHNFSGGKVFTQSLAFASSLEKYLIELNNDINLTKNHPELSNLINQSLKSLSLCAYLDAHNSNGASTPLIIEKLLMDRNRDFPLLIPISTQNHYVQIGIENIDDKYARLSLYNSGFGCGTHPKWPTSNKYQLNMTIDQVPLTDLFSHKHWEKFNKESTIEDFYKYFYELGKNGKRIPPSTQPEDYQKTQMQGTCATMGFMTWWRSFLLRNIQGSSLEKHGVYRNTKTRVLSILGQEKLEHADPIIKSDLVEKLKKIDLELAFAFAKKMENVENFNIALNNIISFLKKINEHKFIDEVMEPYKINQLSTPTEKFAFLRLCHKHIAYHFLENFSEMEQFPEIFDPTWMQNFPLASMIIQEKLIQSQRTNNELDNLFYEFKVTKLTERYLKRKSRMGMYAESTSWWG